MNNTSKELWKDVIYPGVRENMYEVSNKGRIRNKNTKRILPGYKHKSGYIYINLMKPGKGSYVFRYHRIVATAWVSGHTEERDVVNHIDGNKQNNDPSNLEWVTFEENVQHAFRNHLFKPRIVRTMQIVKFKNYMFTEYVNYYWHARGMWQKSNISLWRNTRPTYHIRQFMVLKSRKHGQISVTNISLTRQILRNTEN